MISRPISPAEPVAAPERPPLQDWLDFHRATLLMKCAGLDTDALTPREVHPRI